VQGFRDGHEGSASAEMNAAWILTVVVLTANPIFDAPQIVYAVAMVAHSEDDCEAKAKAARAKFEADGGTVKTDCDVVSLGKSISKKRGNTA
jgi:hypothetical protein